MGCDRDPNTGLPCDGKVFLFNTMSNFPATSGGTCQGIAQNGNHDITIRPMLGPFADSDPRHPYEGFQIYQDSRCQADLQVGGSMNFSAAGTIYIPSGTIHLNGNPATIDYVRARTPVGNLYVNREITGAMVGRQPFGGNRLSGTGSKAGGPDYLLEFCESRVVCENTTRHGLVV